MSAARGQQRTVLLPVPPTTPRLDLAVKATHQQLSAWSLDALQELQAELAATSAHVSKNLKTAAHQFVELTKWAEKQNVLSAKPSRPPSDKPAASGKRRRTTQAESDDLSTEADAASPQPKAQSTGGKPTKIKASRKRQKIPAASSKPTPTKGEPPSRAVDDFSEDNVLLSTSRTEHPFWQQLEPYMRDPDPADQAFLKSRCRPTSLSKRQSMGQPDAAATHVTLSESAVGSLKARLVAGLMKDAACVSSCRFALPRQTTVKTKRPAASHLDAKLKEHLTMLGLWDQQPPIDEVAAEIRRLRALLREQALDSAGQCHELYEKVSQDMARLQHERELVQAETKANEKVQLLYCKRLACQRSQQPPSKELLQDIKTALSQRRTVMNKLKKVRDAHKTTAAFRPLP
eukprot:m.104856 g.104856  ORF g.104856 m.104856 type:complete len:403 (-) comp15674_c0_seq2:56-1264(-)